MTGKEIYSNVISIGRIPRGKEVDDVQKKINKDLYFFMFSPINPEIKEYLLEEIKVAAEKINRAEKQGRDTETMKKKLKELWHNLKKVEPIATNADAQRVVKYFLHNYKKVNEHSNEEIYDALTQWKIIWRCWKKYSLPKWFKTLPVEMTEELKNNLLAYVKGN